MLAELIQTEVLGKLTQEERLILDTLIKSKGSYQEIAELLNSHKGTVNKRMYDIQQRFKLKNKLDVALWYADLMQFLQRQSNYHQ